MLNRIILTIPASLMLPNNDIAHRFFDCVEHYAQTIQGRSILNACGIDRLAVRGSGAFIVSSEPSLFNRDINDIDLRVVASAGSPFNRMAAEKLMPVFFSAALNASGMAIEEE